MRKWMLMTAILAVGTVTMAQQTAAPAADSPFLAFMKKVLAAAPEEFAALKGEEDTTISKEHTSFQGTLIPEADSKCMLHTRRGEELQGPPLYACQLHPPQTFDDAKLVYEKAAAELRAAFPNWKIEEKKTGDESKRQESWTLTAKQPGFTVLLNLYDWGNLSDALSGKPSGKPGVIVSLDVTDTAREKEKPKTPAAREMTASLSICKFIEKVRAANKDNFAALRSPKPVEASGAYTGTLRPDAQAKCQAFPGAQGTGNGRYYTCDLRRTETLAELQPEYDRLKTELQACYSNLRFKEEIRDKDKNPDDSMYFTGSYLTGKNTLWEIALHARDDASTVKAAAEKTGADPKLAPNVLILSVTILQ